MAKRFLNNITINDSYSLPTADGTADQVVVTDGSGNLSFTSLPESFKAITIEDPTDAESVTLFYTPYSIDLSRLAAIIQGASSSVSYRVRFASSRGAVGTSVTASAITVSSTTTANTVTSFTSSTIPADNWVWVETTATTGTPESLNLTVSYSKS